MGARAHLCTHTHTRIHMHISAHPPVCMHALIRTHTCVYSPTCMHAHSLMHRHTAVYTHVHTHTPSTHAHSCILMCAHNHTCTLICKGNAPRVNTPMATPIPRSPRAHPSPPCSVPGTSCSHTEATDMLAAWAALKRKVSRHRHTPTQTTFSRF